MRVTLPFGRSAIMNDQFESAFSSLDSELVSGQAVVVLVRMRT